MGKKKIKTVGRSGRSGRLQIKLEDILYVRSLSLFLFGHLCFSPLSLSLKELLWGKKMSGVRKKMVGNWSTGNLFHLIPVTGEICQGIFPLCHSLLRTHKCETLYLSQTSAMKHEVWHLSFQRSLSWPEREIEGMYYWFHVAQLTSLGCHAHVVLLAMLIS